MKTANKELERLNLSFFYRWIKSYKFYSVIFILYFLSCMFFLLVKGKRVGWIRYEIYYDLRPCIYIFSIALIVIILYGIATLLYMQMKSNAFYRHMILPQSRVTFIISEILMNMSAICLLLILQFLVYYIGYHYYTTLDASFNLENGFYLSITRGSTIRYLFPLTITQLCILISSILMSSTLIVYIGTFSHKIKSYALLLLGIGALIYAWAYPFGLSFSVQRMIQLVLILFMLALTVYCFHKALRKNEFRG